MNSAPRWRFYLIALAALLALVVAGVLLAFAGSHQDAGIRGLPPGAREQVFRESLSEVRSTCLESYSARGPLREHCLEQARFVLRFPECGPECRTAANAVLPHAHR